MNLFNECRLKFDRVDWRRDPELALVDTIIEKHPELIEIAAEDITKGKSRSQFGRKDIPSVEQIVRAAIFKELKGLDYRNLEYAQEDSRVCGAFVKLNQRKPFKFQTLQRYIASITEETLTRVLRYLNQIAIDEGLESLGKIRMDSTDVETNIHYPTNNSLIWDCIRKSCEFLEKLQGQTKDLKFRDYRKSAKKNFFKINNTKPKEKREELFAKQFTNFTKCINQVDQVIRNPKKKAFNLESFLILVQLWDLYPIMKKVYNVAYRREILGERVPSKEKIFSIFERHTDIIVKGGREVKFGHKIQLATGKSNLIMDCKVLKGNPPDTSLFSESIDRITENYNIIPRDVSSDGGYASTQNRKHAEEKGIKNIVFNKVTKSLKNITSSKKIETQLKKWRSGIEGIIGTLKNKLQLKRVNWKGQAHFSSKVMWTAITHNIRVMTGMVLQI